MGLTSGGRKRLKISRDFHIWKVLGGGGALRGLKRLTYDGVVYFYFRYPLDALPFIRSTMVSVPRGE